MISKLKGIVDTILDTQVIIDVGGVGYGVFVPQKTLTRLPLGSTTTLWIETVVREDAIALYGFLTQLEHETFLLLTTVQGIGPKAGLSILSTLSPEQVSSAILSGDIKAFASANGIGKRTADIQRDMSMARDGTAEDAISALSNLGYTRTQSFDVVMNIVKQNPMIGMNDLIKLALKEITKM